MEISLFRSQRDFFVIALGVPLLIEATGGLPQIPGEGDLGGGIRLAGGGE